MDKDAILAELQAAWNYEIRQPGDVDALEISEMFGCSPEGVRGWMKRFERDGTYKRFTVRGANNKTMLVWRKVT